MSKKTPPAVKKFPTAKQRRMDELLERNAAGTITLKEKAKLESLVEEAETLMVENGKLLAKYAASQRPVTPTTAMPVTVWVTPDSVRS